MVALNFDYGNDGRNSGSFGNAPCCPNLLSLSDRERDRESEREKRKPSKKGKLRVRTTTVPGNAPYHKYMIIAYSESYKDASRTMLPMNLPLLEHSMPYSIGAPLRHYCIA